MISRIILLGLVVAAFSSCSSAYRTGQTPDDVYFSPARESAAYVKTENNDDTRYRNEEYVNPDDRWLRMRVRNRYRWSTFDDYAYNDWRYNTWSHNSYYSYSPFNTYSPFNNYWSNYYSWNSYYNPYCTRVIVVNPKTNPVVYNRVRNFNLNSYSNNVYSNSNAQPSRGIFDMKNSGYNNNSSNQNAGRRVFSNTNATRSSSRDSYYTPSSSERPTRVYQPSSSSSSNSPSSSRSSGGSSGGSSGASSGSSSGSRPSRGN